MHEFFMFYLLIVVGISFCVSTIVEFDGRSFMIDGERKLFVSGSVHYPRVPREEWSSILRLAKDNGINIIQTYVFWDIHEPVNNQWNFPSSATSSDDLVAFIQEAASLDLYVHLRIAGYICAEWNFGGLPVWLRELNSTVRTYDEVWLEELSQFVEKTISVVKSAGLLAGQGGPIVMLQIENEYGNMEAYYGEQGHKYVKWLSDYALSLDVAGVPWIMCQQGEGVGTAPDAAIVNACNGFYCDNWISSHASDFPSQPHMWTENWPGWFQNWGEAHPHRPAVDVAFAVTRWYARGGSYMAYYMAFGGTTFGRKVGGPLIVTSYDYDVQINEYGMRAEPKFSLLQSLHQILYDYAATLLSQMPPAAVSLTNTCESHTYNAVQGDPEENCIAFLSNWGERDSCTFPCSYSGDSTGDDCDDKGVVVPPWSVTILTGRNCSNVAFNTKMSAETVTRANVKVATMIDDFHLGAVTSVKESLPPRTSNAVVKADWPLEQLSLTGDSTDYLWYSTTVEKVDNDARNATLQFSSGIAGGGLFYVYVNGVRVASTLGSPGGNPILTSQTDKLKTTATSADRSTRRATIASYSISDRSGDVMTAAGVRDVYNFSVTVPLPKGHKDVRLDLLSVSMGLKNYGPFLETIQVGIVSNITVDGVVLKGIAHTVGLEGERKGFSDKGVLALNTDEECLDLCWHSAQFLTPSTIDFTSHIALQLVGGSSTAGTHSEAMGKGAVWVNGRMLGRYWNVSASVSVGQNCDGCTSSEYVGAYGGEKCRTGCGEPSQQYYKLPVEWLYPAHSAKPNKLVLFEELGGDPRRIQLVSMSMRDV